MMNESNKWLIYWQSMLEMCENKLSDIECDMLDNFNEITAYYPKTFEEIETHMELTAQIKYIEEQLERHRG